MAQYNDPEWITGTAAVRIIKGGFYRLHIEALSGRIRTKAEPGRNLRFSRTDVEAFARTTPPGKSGRTANRDRRAVAAGV